MRNVRQEPIAIVGLGCRFPGAENPQAFWQLLRAGRSAIREVPTDRWKPDALDILASDQEQKPVSRWGGFLDSVDRFDWRAFRILPREVTFMDPQHRLLLEVAWEAFEDAGITLDAMAGSRTGVFIGIIWQDYLRLQARNWSRLDGYTATGNPSSFAASRLSYFFDLKGPNLSLDAACTSSLASVHLACQSLWSGETEMALAGGVNLMLSPDTMILVSRTGMLSSDGYCRTLDAQADGFVRGEGAGIVVLKPLSKVKPEDRVYALIRGIASNHNGHNEWMIASDESAQRELLQEAYQRAGVDPARVDYVELQGTGFRRGDAIEARALGSVLGASSQRTRPCLVGSVKTNIGHLEAASGIASLIKVALSLYHHEIPPTLHLETINPAIPLEELGIQAQLEHGPWPDSDTLPLAGVTTLALTGANAHAILEAFPRITRPASAKDGADESDNTRISVLPLSARSKEALQAQIVAMRDFLRDQIQHGTTDWHNVCYTASVRRTHHEFRSAVVAGSSRQAAHALDVHLECPPGDASTFFVKQRRRIMFLLPRDGIQWSGINAEFLWREPVARAILDACDRIFTNITHRALFADSIRASEAFMLSLRDTERQQIAIFAFQCALASLWRSWGVEPEGVVGEGVGEVAAAYIANAISLEEAVQILVSDSSLFLDEASKGIGTSMNTRTTTIPCYSATRELPGKEREFAVSHWEQRRRDSDLDINAIDQLLTDGYDAFISLGPPSALPGAILMRLQYHDRQGIVLESLGVGEKLVILEALSRLYMLGFAVDWSAFYTDVVQCVSLPTYRWQRERFWLDGMDVDTISTPPEKQAGTFQVSSLSSSSTLGEENASTEEILTRLWADVLGLDEVRPLDSFFELGGHSLLAGQLLTRIQKVCRVKLTLEELLRAPTPASCTGLVLSHKITHVDEIVEPVEMLSRPEERYQPFPTTDVQQAYWLGRRAVFELGNVGNHGYIEVEATDFDIQRLELAIQRLIRRHEMLRAVMLPDGQQRILEHVPPFAVEIEDLLTLSAEQQQQHLLEIRQQMDHELLPLESWPAFRVRVSRLTEQRIRLHLSIESLFIDAWSMHILIQECVRLYLDLEVDLPDLEASFRDYVLAEQHMQESESSQRARAYWSQRLTTLPPAPELPLACNPATIKHPRFVHYENRLDATEWDTLKARGAQAGLTPSSILLTAFAEVLAVWSKNPHFTLNLTLFRRLPLHAQINELVGDFTSLILLEANCGEEISFEARARLLQERLWRDLDHSDYSGIRVLRDLGRAQNETTRALMPVVFTSLLVQDIASSYQAPWQETIYSVSQTPQVWLDHQVLEQHGDLVFHWQVIEDLFPNGLIPTLFDAYAQLLHRLASTECYWMEPVRGLVPPYQLDVRQQRNATSSARPEHILLHTLVLEQAEAHPENPAVITPSLILSYGELLTGATVLAQELRQGGAHPGQLVAVVMEKGWEQVVAVLAILLSGAAYVPIDPALPSERLHLLLAQSEVEQILTQSWLDRSLFWPSTARRLCVDALDLMHSDLPPLFSVQQPDDLAYVIYTSGSTGIPKGVMIEHRSAVNTIVDLNQRFSISSQDRVLGLSALNFDLSVYDIFGVLAAGGAIVLPEDEEAVHDPRLWLALIRDERITLWNTVPALWQILVEYAEHHPTALTGLPLRLAWLSGDWIPLSLPDRTRALLPELQIISMGGATEASIWSIIYPVKSVQPEWASIPYGWPMENQNWQILNERLEPTPDWVVGHLYIGGIGLARGYWRDKEKTASKFVLHPRTGERLYSTGDLGRYWPDGTIEFLGREDLQVKIHGYRIELGEIEVALRQHPSIQDAVVIAAGASQDARRLLAYVVPESANSLSPALVRAFLQERLPGYMVPSNLSMLESFPLTPNGKIDRKALLILAQQEAPAQPAVNPQSRAATSLMQENVPEEYSLTARVLKLVLKVLNIVSLDPFADLIEYGATSLDIFRISNALDSELHVHIEFSQLFRLSTVAAIAEYCQEQLPDDALFTDVFEQRRRQQVDPVVEQFHLLLDPAEREQFKDTQPGLRLIEEGQRYVQLIETEQKASLSHKYAERRSHRKFVEQPVRQKQLSELLGCLRQISLDSKPKYQWGSAGSLYPVQAYVYVKTGCVEGIDSGIYYYHPVEHQLLLITPDVQIERGIFGAVNQHIFERSAFGIFLVGQFKAVAPMYGELSKDFCLIEAGLMTQLLEMSAPSMQLALCQIGGVGFDRVRDLFALDNSSLYLHCLLGGTMEVGGEADL